MSRSAGEGTAPVTSEPSNLNVANALTVLRLALVPVFVWLLFAAGGQEPAWRIAAFVVFVVAAATDGVDGDLARRRGLVTDFGKLVDPIADKALTGAAFIGLSLLGELPWWVTVVVLARELGITALRFFVLRHGILPSSHGGKIKTVLQATALAMYVLPLSGALSILAGVVMALAVVVTVLTGVDYAVRALHERRARAACLEG